jgi:hypothetical protein
MSFKGLLHGLWNMLTVPTIPAQIISEVRLVSLFESIYFPICYT